MESRENKDFDLYKDIQGRTGGEIYIGVVGPVRTGKSTFIKRFMDLFVLPYITDENTKKRAEDELPQSAAGKTIMTTEPKFIPQEAANITLADQSDIRVRLIDCVGFMVDGASGHMEGDNNRMVNSGSRHHRDRGYDGWFYWGTFEGKLHRCGANDDRGTSRNWKTICHCAEFHAPIQ